MNEIPNGPSSPNPIEWRRHFNISMKAGLYIGIAFALNALSLLAYNHPLIQLIVGLTSFVMVPVLLITTAIKYRDTELGGRITYLRSVSFMTWSYLFGVLISTVAFYTVFSVLFKDATFLGVVDNALQFFLEAAKDSENSEEMRQALMGISPRSLAFNIATTQLFFGLIFMYIAALFVRR